MQKNGNFKKTIINERYYAGLEEFLLIRLMDSWAKLKECKEGETFVWIFYACKRISIFLIILKVRDLFALSPCYFFLLSRPSQTLKFGLQKWHQSTKPNILFVCHHPLSTQCVVYRKYFLWEENMCIQQKFIWWSWKAYQ